MAAQNTDKLRKVARKWVGQVGAGGVESGTVTTVPLASTANLPTETAIMITIDRVDANGVLTPDKEEGIIGVVSGDNLSSCIRGVEGTAQAHSVGAVVEVLWTAKNVNDIVDAILAEHSQSGAHTTDTISEKTEDAGVTVDGVKHKDGQVYTDQINEKTANTGVTVDGVKMKDNGFPDFPRCSVYKSATQVISNNTETTVTFDSEQFDVGGMHDNTTNNSRITIPSGQGGLYLITAIIVWGSNVTGYRRVMLYKNNSLFLDLSIIDGDTGGLGVQVYTNNALATASDGDYFEIRVVQTSGGDLNLYNLYFQMAKIA